MRKCVLFIALLLLGQTASSQETGANEWRFEITPYLWLPTISADLNYAPPPTGGGGPSIDAGPTDWLDLLNGAALLSGGARKGRFSLYADFVYLSLKSEGDSVVAVREGTIIPVDASVNLATQTRFEGASWSLAAGYSVGNSERWSTDVIGGVRYFGVKVRTNWDLTLDVTAPGGGIVLPAQGSREEDTDLLDGIVGIRGYGRIGDGRWRFPYYLDIGTGSSDLTWQAIAGFSYQYDWGDLMLVFRHLAYDEGSDGLLEDLSLSGPLVGARFRF